MAPFVYQGPYERTYPESRDSYAVPLGTVKPGDVLDLPEAPDQYWTPYEGGSNEPGEPPAAPDEAAPAGEPGSDGGDAPQDGTPGE